MIASFPTGGASYCNVMSCGACNTFSFPSPIISMNVSDPVSYDTPNHSCSFHQIHAICCSSLRIGQPCACYPSCPCIPSISNLPPFFPMNAHGGTEATLGRAEGMVREHMSKCICSVLYFDIADCRPRYDPSHDWAHGTSSTNASLSGADNVSEESEEYSLANSQRP